MKPFIYNFLEKPEASDFDYTSLIEYSTQLNLSVFKGTQHPAISEAVLSTQTTTKAGIEGADSDRQETMSMGTMTITRANIEGTDHDHHTSLSMFMGTQTLTLTSSEGIDSDADRRYQN